MIARRSVIMAAPALAAGCVAPVGQAAAVSDVDQLRLYEAFLVWERDRIVRERHPGATKEELEDYERFWPVEGRVNRIVLRGPSPIVRADAVLRAAGIKT